MPKFRSKNTLFSNFSLGTPKNFYRVGNQHHRICLTTKFGRKTKIPKFGTKNALFVRFWAKYFKKIAIFEINTLDFVYLQNFVKNQKCPNLRPKMLFFRIFGVEFQKKYEHFWYQHPGNSLNAKVREKIDMGKFGTKTDLFVYFWLLI